MRLPRPLPAFTGLCRAAALHRERASTSGEVVLDESASMTCTNEAEESGGLLGSRGVISLPWSSRRVCPLSPLRTTRRSTARLAALLVTELSSRVHNKHNIT